MKSFTLLFPPLLIIVLSIPMILEKVPRNHLYGFRTAYTLSSDEVWYRANKISGIALLIAGLLWLVLALAFPNLKTVTLLGVAGLAVGVVISFWLTYRTRSDRNPH